MRVRVGRNHGASAHLPLVARAKQPASHNAAVPYNLERFVSAQGGIYPGALRELRAGRKTGHWIWFIFPQLAGLGRSEMSRRYGIESIDEARAYLAHPILGPRLLECAGAVLGTSGVTADQIFGSLDAMKVRSSMTLFHRAAPGEPSFIEMLDRFYAGVADEATDALLREPLRWR
jgi:uncharacterized protein (DUF1810 family)